MRKKSQDVLVWLKKNSNHFSEFNIMQVDDNVKIKSPEEILFNILIQGK